MGEFLEIMSRSILKNVLRPIYRHCKLALFQSRWRKANPYNSTEAVNLFPIEKVSVGNMTYGQLCVYTHGNERSRLYIGHCCSIASEVQFVLDGGHHYERCTTFPFPMVPYNICVDATTKGPIVLEDDVWIGHRCTILSGVTLGRGCVIGAGSVVARSIPPYAIYAGGKIIKMRFSDSLIQKASRIDFSRIDMQTLERYKTYCQTEFTEENADELLEAFHLAQEAE